MSPSIFIDENYSHLSGFFICQKNKIQNILWIFFVRLFSFMHIANNQTEEFMYLLFIIGHKEVEPSQTPCHFFSDLCFQTTTLRWDLLLASIYNRKILYLKLQPWGETFC